MAKDTLLSKTLPRFIQKHSILSIFILSCILGLGEFLVLFGISPLDVTNVNWIYIRGGDSLQHQIGWMAFRSEPWSPQVGLIHSLNYPIGTSIVFSDSIPLLAVLFKFCSPLLPAHFQYFGLWTLACWILTLFFTMLILREFHFSLLFQVLGGLLLGLSPVLIDRVFFHDALCAQWLILAAIFLSIRQIHGSYQPWKWVLLVITSVTIHAYLFLMIGVFFFFNLLLEGITHRHWGRVVLPFLTAVVLTLGVGWCLGMFSFPTETTVRAINYYSFNLGAFFNGDHSSNLIAARKYALEGQYEGFAFLGLGNLLLLLFVLPTFVYRGISRKTLQKYLPVILPAGVLFLLSLGNSLTLDQWVIITIPFPDFLLRFYGTFRSIGRFVWPFYYLAIFGILIYGAKDLPRFPLLVGLAILAQFFDLQPLIQSKSYTAPVAYQSPFQGDFWETAPETNQHIMILPAKASKWVNYKDITVYAVEHHLTLNWVYLARSDGGRLQQDIDRTQKTILNGERVDAQTIYLSDDADFIQQVIKVKNPHLAVCQQGSLWYLISVENLAARSKDGNLKCQTFGNAP